MEKTFGIPYSFVGEHLRVRPQIGRTHRSAPTENGQYFLKEHLGHNTSPA